VKQEASQLFFYNIDKERWNRQKKKLHIGTKIGLGFAAVIALLAILGAVSLASNKSIDNNLKDDIDIVNERLSLEYNIENYFYHAVAGVRGYIAYGKDNFKDDCIYQ